MSGWMVDALCAQVDPELFFPEQGQSNQEAKQICRQCPVQVDCLRDALQQPYGGWGIWGGLSAHERKQLRAPTRYPTPIRHGTEAGAKAHARRGETPCPACLAGQARQSAERKARQQKRRRTA